MWERNQSAPERKGLVTSGAGDGGSERVRRERRKQDHARGARADRAVARARGAGGDVGRHADRIHVARSRPDASVHIGTAPEAEAVVARRDVGEVDADAEHVRVGRNAAAGVVVDDRHPACRTRPEGRVDAGEIVGRRDDAAVRTVVATRTTGAAERRLGGGEPRGGSTVDRRRTGVGRAGVRRRADGDIVAAAVTAAGACRVAEAGRARARNRERRSAEADAGTRRGRRTRVHASVDGRRGTRIHAAADETLVVASVAVVVDRVADLHRGTDRAVAGAEGARAAGLRTVPADAETGGAGHEREAGLGKSSARDHVVVRRTIAVVVDPVAGLGDGCERRDRRNAGDGPSADALDGAGRGAASRSDGACSPGGRTAAAGRAVEVAVVAVLVDRVAADLRRRSDFTHARAPDGRAGEADARLRAGHADAAARVGGAVGRRVAVLDDVVVDHAVAVVVDTVAGLARRHARRHVAADHACRAGVGATTDAGSGSFRARARDGNDARIGAADDARVADAVAVLVVHVAANFGGRNDLVSASAEDASRAEARARAAEADARGTGATRVAALDVAVDAAVAVVVLVVAGFGSGQARDRVADELVADTVPEAVVHAAADAGATCGVVARITTARCGEEKTAVAVLVDRVVGDLRRRTDRSGAGRPRHRGRVPILRAVAARCVAGVAGGEREARARDVVVDDTVAVVVEAVGRDALAASSRFVGLGGAILLVAVAAAPDAGAGADAETGRAGHHLENVGVGVAGRAHAGVADRSGVAVGHARVRNALAPDVAAAGTREAELVARTERSVRGRTARVHRADRVALPHPRHRARNGRRDGGGAGDLPAVARDEGTEVARLERADRDAVGTEAGLPGSALDGRAHVARRDERLDAALRDGSASTDGGAQDRERGDEQEVVQERGRTIHDRTLSSV